MRGLVLSLFPGVDLLGRAFEEQGWCVVWGPDVIYARDIRGWHCPPGRFDGVIGGPPCQCFSALANIVRANGYEPKFGDLHPEFCRVVAEAAPTWWLCENVPQAPTVEIDGYNAEQFFLSPRWLGDAQSRKRKFTFGSTTQARIESRISVTALESIDYSYAQTGGSANREGSRLPFNAKSRSAAAAMAAAQGWPGLDSRLEAFTVAAKCKALGNGVPKIMASEIARAIGEWCDQDK